MNRQEWLDSLKVGDPVMQVDDRGHYPPLQFTVYTCDAGMIRVKRLTCIRKYRRSDGREYGGFSWHIDPVEDSGE